MAEREFPLPSERRKVEKFKVVVRICPLKWEEKEMLVQAVDGQTLILNNPRNTSSTNQQRKKSQSWTYKFDAVCDQDTTQENIYSQTTKSLIQTVVSGFNAAIFAYGATGAGKTFTMVGTNERPGIMLQSLNDLFTTINDLSTDEKFYKLTMSYLEIYNETIRDLLNPTTQLLDLREDSKQNVRIIGLSEVSPSSTSEIMAMLLKGNKSRTVEPTAANKTSSRSHALLQVNVFLVDVQDSEDDELQKEVRIGVMYMIDLAGSERAFQTQNEGKRLREGAHINRSLLALGNCINSLAGKSATKFVNFRDSKLTRLLKDALNGNCRSVMIAHISPASGHFEDTRNTLAYAYRAKSIRNKVQKNVVDVTKHVTQYQVVIEELRKEIERLKVKIRNASSSPDVESVPDTTLNSINLGAVKQELLSTFREQMAIRHRLLEVDSRALSLSNELEWNSHLIDKMERESEGLPKLQGIKNDLLAEEVENAKETLQLSQVQQLWDEIVLIQSEQQKCEEEQNELLNRLVDHKIKTDEFMRKNLARVSSSHQLELLALLCKVHELEVEKIEVEAKTVLKEHELRKREIMILQYDHQYNLCKEIITKQRSLIDENKVVCPEDLLNLYDQYRQDGDSLIQAKQHHENTTTPFKRSFHLNSGLSNNQVAGADQLPPIHNKLNRELHTPNLADNFSVNVFREDKVATLTLPPISRTSTGNMKQNLMKITTVVAERKSKADNSPLQKLEIMRETEGLKKKMHVLLSILFYYADKKF